MSHPPERLRRFPLLSNVYAIREGGRGQRGGAALARLPWPGQRLFQRQWAKPLDGMPT